MTSSTQPRSACFRRRLGGSRSTNAEGDALRCSLSICMFVCVRVCPECNFAPRRYNILPICGRGVRGAQRSWSAYHRSGRGHVDICRFWPESGRIRPTSPQASACQANSSGFRSSPAGVAPDLSEFGPHLLIIGIFGHEFDHFGATSAQSRPDWARFCQVWENCDDFDPCIRPSSGGDLDSVGAISSGIAGPTGSSDDQLIGISISGSIRWERARSPQRRVASKSRSASTSQSSE